MPERVFIRMLTGDDLVVEAPVPIDWRGRSARALFALLALHPGEPVSRDRLAGLLWPNSDQQAARASLRMALLGLRRALDPIDPMLVQATNETVALALDRAAVDWVQFEALATAPDTASRLEALELYRGDLATAFAGPHEGAAELLRDLRERLRDLAIATGAGLVAELDRNGTREQVRPLVQKVLAIDPANEPVHRTMMEVAAAAGDRPAVLRQFEQCRNALREHYGLDPSAETVALRDRLVGAACGRQDAPARAAAGPSGSPGPVPRPPSGRSRRWWLMAAAVAALIAATFALRPLMLPGPDHTRTPPIVAVSVHFDPADARAEQVSDRIIRAFDQSLRRIPELVVVLTSAPASSLPDPLAESYVVTATVLRSAARLRVHVEFHDTRPDTQPWYGKFDLDASDPRRLERTLEEELKRGLIPEIRARITASGEPLPQPQ